MIILQPLTNYLQKTINKSPPFNVKTDYLNDSIDTFLDEEEIANDTDIDEYEDDFLSEGEDEFDVENKGVYLNTTPTRLPMTTVNQAHLQL